jgi:hypothetical protein
MDTPQRPLDPAATQGLYAQLMSPDVSWISGEASRALNQLADHPASVSLVSVME